MFKKFLFAAAFVMASNPAFVSAQDFFFSFDEFSRQPTLTQASPAAGGPATGQVFIFSDVALDFNNIDLDFTVDNPGVASFTNGVAADSDGSFTSIVVEDPNVVGGPLGPTDGRIFGFAFVFLFQLDLFDYGQLPFDTSDAEFRAGANGFLLATVDYSVAGVGQANFDFILGDLGVANSRGGGGPPIILDPDFGGSTGTLTVVSVPEPVAIRGDANQDGDVDFSDIPFFISFLQSGIFQAESDADGNGAVEFADIPVFINILQTQP